MKQRESGFTIVETTLVLAITGILAVLTLIGIGNALNHQRYTDAVDQTVDFFRGQYAQASGMVNNRPLNENCNSVSGITTPANPAIRGATECMLVGKILHSSDGKKVTVSQVLALNDPTTIATVSTMSDNDILNASGLVQGNIVEDYDLEWGTVLLAPGSSNPAAFTIMIVRTPVSGAIHTYNSSSADTAPTDLLALAQSDAKLCIDRSGFFSLSIAPMGVGIVKDAVNTTGVRIISAGDCV